MANKPLTDEEIIALLRKEESAAWTYQTGTLSPIRTEAYKYYNREPYGDEQEGQSKVVTSEYQDVIESVMPGLMEVFAGGDQVVQFVPMSPGQEKLAEEASEYVGHVFMAKNKGFLLLHTALKDALMHRLGGISVDLDDEDETRTVPVRGIDQNAVDILISEAQAQSAELEMELTPDPAPADVMGGLPVSQTFSGSVTITKRKKCVKAFAIAPEDIRFTPTARSQDEASFIGYVRKATASELKKLGVEEDELSRFDSVKNVTEEDMQRTDGALEVRFDENDSEKEYWLGFGYLRADINGDGISENSRVLYAHAGGTAGKIIECTPWEGPAAIALASPILMPHEIVGRSLFDQTKDLQQIGSVITREMLNNLYLSNSPRPVIDDQVLLDTMLDWTPGSPIRLKAGARAVDGHVQWMQVPSVMDKALAALEYFNTVRENRTGTSRQSQGLDSDSLNKTARGMNLLMSASAQRQKLMARVLAETFVARVYRLIYRAVKEAAKGPVTYWTGNTFKQADPSQWPDDMDLTINVGLGTGNTQQELEHLMMLAQAQEKLVTLQGGPNGPFVTPDNIANLTQKLAEKLGFKTQGLFFQPAEKVMQEMAAKEGQPPPQPLEVMVEQAKTQGAIEVQKAQLAGDLQKVQAEQQAEAAKNQAEFALKSMEMDLKRQELALRQQEIELKAQDLAHKRNAEAMSMMQAHQAEQAKASEAANKDAGLHGVLSTLGEGLKAQGEGIAAGMQALAQAALSEQEIVRGPDGKVAGSRRRPPKGPN